MDDARKAIICWVVGSFLVLVLWIIVLFSCLKSLYVLADPDNLFFGGVFRAIQNLVAATYESVPPFQATWPYLPVFDARNLFTPDTVWYLLLLAGIWVGGKIVRIGNAFAAQATAKATPGVARPLLQVFHDFYFAPVITGLIVAIIVALVTMLFAS